MSQEIKVTFLDNNNGWKLPFNLALGVHIVFILSVVYMPQLLHRKPLFPDIYTIDLVNVQEPASEIETQKPAPLPPSTPTEKVTPETQKIVKKAVPVLDKPLVEEPVLAVKKPVSIKPLKRKILKKTIPSPTVLQKKKLEALNKKYLDEAKEAERLAEEAARIAALEAVNQLKQMIRETNALSKSPKADTAKVNSNAPVRANRNVVESQYFASVFNKLQPHWSLPEYKVWDPDLVAVIVIQIQKNGEITRQFFEKKSGDRLFDQFVLKTLQDGSPLPVIPDVLQKDSLEIGLRFRPGSIQF